MCGHVAPVHCFSPLQGGEMRSFDGCEDLDEVRFQEPFPLAPDLDPHPLAGQDAGDEDGLAALKPGQTASAVHEFFDRDLRAFLHPRIFFTVSRSRSVSADFTTYASEHQLPKSCL